MKAFLICITPAQGQSYSYTGLFAHSVDAITHAMDLTRGEPARISARVLA